MENLPLDIKMIHFGKSIKVVKDSTIDQGLKIENTLKAKVTEVF